eukprot:15659302-Heterocapsa_arctica.AAC.1
MCYPVLEGVDPTTTPTALCAAATTAVKDSLPTGAPVSSGPGPAPPHRNKLTKPQTPLWCGLLTRIIKPGTEEF